VERGKKFGKDKDSGKRNPSGKERSPGKKVPLLLCAKRGGTSKCGSGESESLLGKLGK